MEFSAHAFQFRSNIFSWNTLVPSGWVDQFHTMGLQYAPEQTYSRY